MDELPLDHQKWEDKSITLTIHTHTHKSTHINTYKYKMHTFINEMYITHIQIWMANNIISVKEDKKYECSDA